jgi:hypothetical protein
MIAVIPREGAARRRGGAQDDYWGLLQEAEPLAISF